MKNNNFRLICKIISISLNKSARNVKQNNDNKKVTSNFQTNMQTHFSQFE